MKILDLKFGAFGPFLKQQHIPFEQLNEKGIFLINGPTGAGKTTIFDAIVFALYGKASGDDRDSKMLRSDFAPEGTPGSVELTFSIKDKIYKITRKTSYISKNRNGIDKNNSESVVLEMPNHSVYTRTKDVNEKIINDIIFLNRDQFKSVALLAQGEFTRLITASSNDRAEILEHIFQQQIYDRFQDLLVIKQKEMEDEVESQKTELQTLIGEIADLGVDIEGIEEASYHVENIPTLLSNITVFLRNLKVNKDEEEKKFSNCQKLFTDLSSKLKLIEQKNEQIKKYIDAKNQLKNLEKLLMEDAKKQKIVDSYNESQKLSHLIQTIDDLNNKINDEKISLKNAKNELTIIEKDEKDLSNNLNKYKEYKEDTKKINVQIDKLTNLNEDQSFVLEAKNEYELADKEYSDDFKKFQQLEKEFLSAEKLYLSSSSARLAKELKNGVPCPVCGSKVHPNPCKFQKTISNIEFDQLKKEFNDFKSNIDKSHISLINLKAKFETKHKKFFDSLKTLKINDLTLANCLKINLQNKIDKLIEKKSNEETFISNYENKSDSLGQSKVSVIKEIKMYVKSINNNESKLKSLEEKLEKLFSQQKIVKNKKQYFEIIEKFNDIEIQEMIDEINQHNIDNKVNKAIIESTPKDCKTDKLIADKDLIRDEENARIQFNEQKNKTAHLNNLYDGITRLSTKISKKYSNCKERMLEYNELDDLSKTANGANRLKLSFKIYILADYFDKIIKQANIRLQVISNGRYKLIRRNELGIGGARQGLDLDVFDIETGKTRSASSLSGGEKFVSALSLALGLSDIIETEHSNVQIDSVFIDEGFGTLDEKYIDMAVKALESLQTLDKTIAIISHVEKLKEYIPDSINVEKDEIGSKIKIKSNI